MRLVSFDAALGDVAVRAGWMLPVIALLPDLRQQLLDRYGGVFGAAGAQVVAVGVDQRGPVFAARGSSGQARRRGRTA